MALEPVIIAVVHHVARIGARVERRDGAGVDIDADQQHCAVDADAFDICHVMPGRTAPRAGSGGDATAALILSLPKDGSRQSAVGGEARRRRSFPEWIRCHGESLFYCRLPSFDALRMRAECRHAATTAGGTKGNPLKFARLLKTFWHVPAV